MSSSSFQVLPQPGFRHVLVRDLVMESSIGIHPQELETPQRVRVNLVLLVPDNRKPLHDNIENVVDYDKIIAAVRHEISAGHVRLIETLADRIAELCLADRRIRTAYVQVEKLDVYADTAAVGIAIHRENLSALQLDKAS